MRLQLRWQHQFQFAGYYLAVDRGYYANAKLDVELVEATAERSAITEVANGHAEYGVGSSDLVLARARGQDVVALAAFFQHSPLVILSLSSSAIDSVHDLAGKRVAIENEAADLVAYLKSEGLAPTAYQALPHAQSVRDLLDGRIDAMSAYQSDEPFELERAKRDIRIFSPRASGIDFYGDTLFTSAGELSRHPERVRAFVEASRRGWADALADPNAGIEAVLRRSQRHSREHLAYEAHHTAPLISADIVELGYMNPARWQHIADTYASLGLIAPNTDLHGFVYREPSPGIPTWLFGVVLGALLVLAAIAAGWVRALRLAKALEGASARWRRLLDASPLATLVIGDDATVRYENPQATKLQSEVRDLVPTLLGTGVIERLRQHDAKREEVQLGARWFTLSAGLADVDGGGLLIKLVEVTAQKELARSLRVQAEREAQQAVERAEDQRRLVAILSHEFRNPLTGIDRAANLLELSTDLKESASAQRLSSIRSQVSRLHMVVDNILLTDPVHGDSLKPRLDSLSVAEMLRDARDALTQEMAERVVIAVEPPTLEALADARLLRLALSNLIDNALRYAPAPTPVNVSARVEAEALVLVVEDQGRGVPPEQLEKLGTPYNAKPGSQRGSGLGYYFTRLIVLAHGGEIVPANRGGGGFRVTLRLPLT